MGLDINKAEMNQAWVDRHKSQKFYNYLYMIARHIVSKKVSNKEEREDLVQFCIYKCYKHQEAYKPERGDAYSFFWKQVALAVGYKKRKEARRNTKIKTFTVEQEKILDWAEQQYHKDDGESFNSIVDTEELVALKAAFKYYNKKNGTKLKPNKANAKIVICWLETNEPGFINQFSTLKSVFKSWYKSSMEA